MSIDEGLIEAGSSWLLASQLTSGKFIETYMFPDDRKVPLEFKVNYFGLVYLAIFK